MAKRRMFSLDVIDTDHFLDMPASAQNLFFHLGTRADDDGFIGAPQRIARSVGASPDDYKLLIAKGYVIPFDSGVCALRHWKICNYLRGDRYNPTAFTEERNRLFLHPSGTYEITAIGGGVPLGIPRVAKAVGNRDTQVRLGKVRLGKVSVDIIPPPDGERKPSKTRSNFVPPSVEEVTAYVRERGSKIDPQRFHDHYTANGWMAGRAKMKDWKAALRNWERNEPQYAGAKQQPAERDYSYTGEDSL